MSTSKSRLQRAQGWAQQNAGFILIASVTLTAIALGLILKGNADTAKLARDTAGLAAHNRELTCAQANSTALGYRQALPGESFDHFALRMHAQRLSLRASRGLGCASLPGLHAFPERRAEALDEIAAVLDPDKPKPPDAPGSVAVPGAEGVVDEPAPSASEPPAPGDGGEQGEQGSPGPQGPPGDDGDNGGNGDSPPSPPAQGPLEPVCDLIAPLGISLCT